MGKALIDNYRRIGGNSKINVGKIFRNLFSAFK